MTSRMRAGILTAVGIIGGVAVAVAVNLATGASIDQWSTAASVVAAVAAVVGLLAAVSTTFFAERATSAADKAERDQEQLGFRLIRTFAAIEQEASLGRQRQSHALSPRPLSLREVSVIMADSGVWDDQDQIGFDLAVRARNAIVHGDLDKVDPLDLQYANEKAEQLLKKVQEAETFGRPTE
ncbi:MAG TPA: hypothetical protein VIY52_34285 [Streptosporangiaceae bacterium]